MGPHRLYGTVASTARRRAGPPLGVRERCATTETRRDLARRVREQPGVPAAPQQIGLRARHRRPEKNNIFTGEFWTGSAALKLGLVDGIGNVDQILKEKFGDKVVIKNMEKPKGFIARKLSSSIQSPIDSLTNTIEEKR